jgi:cell wall-associated NlpC family hydrolase
MHRHLWRWLALVVLAAALVAVPAGAAPTANTPVPTPPTAAPTATATSTATAAARSEARAAARTARAAKRKAARKARVAKRKASRSRARKATRAARSRIGRPYGWGAVGPRAFDCSGLTQWSLRRAGIRLPRTTFAQVNRGFGVKRNKIRAGDLVFFSTNGPGPSHVGVATSRGTVVSATSRGVRKHAISGGYWGQFYVGARRVVNR